MLALDVCPHVAVGQALSCTFALLLTGQPGALGGPEGAKERGNVGIPSGWEAQGEVTDQGAGVRVVPGM